MELIAPTNWDNQLIASYKSLGIKEAYGKMAIDFIGGGRPAYILPYVNRRQVATHIKMLHAAGIKFNYILNSPCLNSEEFTRTGRANIYSLLRWLTEIGVDKVTITIPYLLQLIKDKYPKLEICISVFAGIDSIEKALFWQDIGADEITLLQTIVNRNFSLLKQIRKHTTCRLKLIGNTSCLYNCPLIGYHALSNAHASQSKYSHRAGLSIDYCSIFCKYLRLSEPAKFISSSWIRPEDLHFYEEIGIDGIKLVDRRCSTEQLIKIAVSYSKRHFEGNLFELLPLFYGRPPQSAQKNLLLKLKYFFHPLESNMLAIAKLDFLMRDLKIYIDNRKLDGFIKKFIEQDCTFQGCAECGYCERIAKEVIVYDKDYLEKLKSIYKEFLSNLAKGKI
ncbi:MAG: U32 family peptidase [Candidatus Omnitrophota bacterium]|nr:U32 family peptidase [Candidatus Omnitrophota bacterium]